MLNENDEVIVIDFGMNAKFGQIQPGNITFLQQMKEIKRLLGFTPSYNPPENTGIEAAVNEKTDAFAVGCVFFELLSGQQIFNPVSETCR